MSGGRFCDNAMGEKGGGGGGGRGRGSWSTQDNDLFSSSFHSHCWQWHVYYNTKRPNFRENKNEMFKKKKIM